jgi:hypothetical protein
MTLVLAMAFVLTAVLLAASLMDRREDEKTIKFMNGQLVDASQQIARMAHEHRIALDHIETLESRLAPPPPVTAGDVVQKAVTRHLRLRKSLSEQAAMEALKHNQNEEKHLDTVAQIERIGVQKLQPKKEKK